MHRLRALAQHPEFKRGAHDMLVLLPGLAAWALVTGVAMVKGGLPVPLALLMSLLVFAGSAQLAAVPLLLAGAPLWVVWATALCVNLRFVIFSAQWRPFLMRYRLRTRLALGYLGSDLVYVLFIKRFMAPAAELGAPHNTPHARDASQDDSQAAYLAGLVVVNWWGWQLPGLLGIVLADVIPTAWGLGFAGVLALVGLACSLVSDRATALAAVVAGGAAVAAFALPLRLHIVVAIAAGVVVGLVLDRALQSAAKGAA